MKPMSPKVSPSLFPAPAGKTETLPVPASTLHMPRFTPREQLAFCAVCGYSYTTATVQRPQENLDPLCPFCLDGFQDAVMFVLSPWCAKTDNGKRIVESPKVSTRSSP